MNDVDEVSTRSHHRARWAALGIAGLVVVGAASVLGAYAFRSHPGPRSVGSAVDQYRRSTSSSATGFVWPASGVYVARGSGTEAISVPPDRHDDGPTMPISVLHLANGCWRWRIDYNTAHWHQYDYCPKGGQLLLTAQRNSLSWDFGLTRVTNLADYTCTPPAPIVVTDPRPGSTFTHHCSGTNSAVKGPSVAVGPARILGRETLTIGTRRVAALHQARVEQMSGEQKGTLREEWWFEARTGLPLAASRTYRLVTASPIGSITYTETGSWHLTSLVPKT